MNELKLFDRVQMSHYHSPVHMYHSFNHSKIKEY
jgi:hypothetical protein